MENPSPKEDSKVTGNRILVGLIADEETTIGFLLAGIGESLSSCEERNYLMVSKGTTMEEIETFFRDLKNRKNIGIILIGSEIYQSLANVIKQYKKPIPIVLEIPSKNTIGQDHRKLKEESDY